MAILQISRIQHRRGLSENLPQLASAELGWVVDQRRLYIGNGSIAEGAPEIGNTEILTQYSNILEVIGNYTYKGERTGFIAQNTLPRTLQEKLDETVSVIDYGAVGDGSTDDTSAIKAAIEELFTTSLSEKSRRTLYFPAGVYVISDSLTLPPFATFIGDGADSTFIQQTNSLSECVIQTADSSNQTHPDIATNSAEVPNHIYVEGINFENVTSNHVCLIDSAYDVRFQNVKFSGPYSNESDINLPLVLSSAFSTKKSCVVFRSTPVLDTHTIVFEQCEFEGQVFGVNADDDVNHVVFDKCTFDSLYRGINLGELTSGEGNQIFGPRAFKVTNSYFDRIYEQGFRAFALNQNISSFNTYRDCGNGITGSQAGGSTTPLTTIVDFAANDNYSIGDNFDRTDADDEIFSRVEFNGYLCYSVESDNWVKHGRLKSLPGNKTTLLDNISSATAVGNVTFDPTQGESATIEYTLTRGSNVRRGVLNIALDQNSTDISDDFTENNASLGVTFSTDTSSGRVRLLYTTTTTGNNADFKYNIRLLGE